MEMSERRELLGIALKASKFAQENILKYFQAEYSVEWKADNTPVTIADKSSEELCRNFWSKETPGFGVIGEEFGIESPEAEFQWVIDPIDGTKAFVHGVPLFGTLIALYRRGEPICSLIRIPAMDSCVWALKDGGAFIGKDEGDCRPVRCSGVSKISDSLVLSGTVNTMETEGYGESFAKVRRAARLHRGWGDCYGYYLVAAGRAEVMVDPVVSLWDIAPYPLIFSEAQGAFSTIGGEAKLFDENGKPKFSIYEGYSSVATNGILHAEVLKLMNEK